jgi:transcriptional regulator with XRE-family HTH domain
MAIADIIPDIIPEYKMRRNGIAVEELNSDTLTDTRETGIGTALAATDRDTVKFTANQVRALQALLSQEVKESLASVAARAGVSRNTIWRYMKDETFASEYRRLTLLEVKAQYAPLMRAIMRGAQERGPGQPALARILLEKIGDPVIDHSDNVNRNRQDGIDLDGGNIPINVKRHVCEIFDAIASGEDMSNWVFTVEKLVTPRLGLKLGPTAPRNVTPATPLDEVELNPAPGLV